MPNNSTQLQNQQNAKSNIKKYTSDYLVLRMIQALIKFSSAWKIYCDRCRWAKKVPYLFRVLLFQELIHYQFPRYTTLNWAIGMVC